MKVGRKIEQMTQNGALERVFRGSRGRTGYKLGADLVSNMLPGMMTVLYDTPGTARNEVIHGVGAAISMLEQIVGLALSPSDGAELVAIIGRIKTSAAATKERIPA